MSPSSVLVVDDDEDIRQMVRLVLEGAGYLVSMARDGNEAWRSLENGVPVGLILLDLMMPEMDGEQFLRMKKASRWSNVPVIIMSGHASLFEKAAELSASECLKKPVDLEDLLSAVRQFSPVPEGGAPSS